VFDLLADLYAQEHRLDDVERLMDRVLEVQRSGRDWWCRMIHLRAVAGNFDGALEIWRSHPEVHSDVSTTAFIAQTLYNIGEKDQAEALAFEALAHPELNLEQRIELVNAQAIVQFARGNMARAEKLFGETVELARKTDDPRRIGVALSNQSTARMNLGNYRESAAGVQEALRLFGASGHRRLFAQTQYVLGVLQAELGHAEQAEESLLESLEMLKQSDTQGFLTGCTRALCDLYREWGPQHGRILALRQAHAGLRFARLQRSPRFLVNALPNAAVAEAWNGNPQQALELIEEALPLIDQLNEPAFEMYVHFASGLTHDGLGQPERALEAFRHAQAIAQKLDALIEFHKSGLEVARLTRDLELARTYLAWFKARGLMNGVRIAQRYFPERVQDRLPLDASRLEPEPLFRLEVLGPMQIRQGHTVAPLRGGKRKELLALLLEARIRGRAEVTGLDLCDALYPLEPEEIALGALKATIFKIRSSLGANLITTTGNGYALGAVASDAEDFLQTGDARLWRGPYLEDAALEGRDENVREALHQALEARARMFLETDPQEAARLGRILLSAEPYDLGALEITCRALKASKNNRGALRLYTDSRVRLLEVGETLPEHWEEFLEAQPA
jgi:tetratricopeptide (TPR) repeat protein